MNLFILRLALWLWAIPSMSGGPPNDVQSGISFRHADVQPARGDVSTSWENPAVGFGIRVDTTSLRMKVAALSMHPGQEVGISTDELVPDLVLEADSIQVRLYEGVWYWKAPSNPGITAFRIVDRTSGPTPDTIVVNVFVILHMEASVDGVLDGYRIGAYKPRPSSRGPEYEPPLGLLPVRSEDEDILVSPNFTLGQFVSKQPGNPKFVAYSRALTLKLESVLAEVRRNGFEAPTLTVMSGYRTPWYNRSIGNTTDFSRHLWGDAADIFVDLDRNGEMDDLNDDGRVNQSDAAELAKWVESLMGRRLPRIRPGGLATYERNDAHGPFVHVDARGVRARW